MYTEDRYYEPEDDEDDDIFTFCLQKINPITNKMEY